MNIGLCKLIIKETEVEIRFCIKSVSMHSSAHPDINENSKSTAADVLNQLVDSCYYGYLAACFYNRIEPQFDLVDFWEEYESNQDQFAQAFKSFLEATGVNKNIPEPKDKRKAKKKVITTKS